MSRKSGENGRGGPKKRRKRLRRGAIALIIAGVVLCLLWAFGLLMREDVDAKLAAIEAARAIPDEENAALVYDRLMQDFGSISVPQGLIDGLLQAAEIPQCRFPIAGHPKQFPTRMDRLASMKNWARLLVRTANNDMAEGRIEPGIEKYLALLRLAGHLHQQPVVLDNLVGSAVEALALVPIRCFVLEGPCAQMHAEAIEAALPPVESDWDAYSSKMLEVERLLAQTERRSLLQYVLSFWRNDDLGGRENQRALPAPAHRPPGNASHNCASALQGQDGQMAGKSGRDSLVGAARGPG